MFGCGADVLDDLDAGGAGADDGDAFVAQIDAVLWPRGHVVVFDFEVAEAFEVGCVAAGGDADGGNQPAGVTLVPSEHSTSHCLRSWLKTVLSTFLLHTSLAALYFLST
jgi:hypothetical protein